MPYEITITREIQKTVRRNGQYTVIDRLPWTEAEIAKASEGFYSNNKLEPMHEVRGYAPAQDCLETEKQEVLKQTVEDLDLAAVIKAINKL